MGAPYWMIFQSPWVGAVNFGDSLSASVVTDSIPTIYWTYFDTAYIAQSDYEIEVGTDDDWDVAEMWATGAVASSDTQVVYAGATLDDATQYYLRLRVGNGTDWSSWSFLPFVTRLSPVLHVPIQYATIQEAMAAALAGDTVLVAPGTYQENVVIDLPGVVMIAESDRGSTVIEAVDYGQPAVRITANAVAAVVSGFTICGSQSARGLVMGADSCLVYNCELVNNEDGGIYCYANGCTVSKCTMHDNGVPWSGAGIWLRGDSTSIDSCTFYHCRSVAGGGAIHVDRVDGLTLSYSIGYENSTGSHGGGFIYVYESPNVVLVNNTIVDNSADNRGSAIAIWESGTVELRNNIVAFNESAYGVWSFSTTVVNEYNDVFANYGPYGEAADYFGLVPGTGAFSENPMFTDPFGSDFHLVSGSPCIDAGDPDPQYNDPDGTRNDVGALHACSCCQGLAGDIDGAGDEPDLIDLIYLVTFMFQDGSEPPCMAETDINGDGSLAPDITDLIRLVDYMFQGGPPPASCL
jgi:parallel beta-helix repeat protein